MRELISDLQRFADIGKELYAAFNNDSNANKNLFNSSLPHLRMFSIVANSPFIKPLLEADKDAVNFFQRWVSPVLKYVGAAAKLKFDASKLNEELKIVASVANVNVIVNKETYKLSGFMSSQNNPLKKVFLPSTLGFFYAPYLAKKKSKKL